ncbi:MAG: hypothetical protein JXD19_08205 [Deltaproteobacteria bacterium]|nr:hypothetical protein [Deltaproteobacteria bacterium]
MIDIDIMFRGPRSFLLPCLCLGMLLVGCHGAGGPDEDESTFIEGRLYLVGNEPFAELALETRDGKVYTLRGDTVPGLRRLQGQGVRLEGKVITDQRFRYSSAGFLVYEYHPISANRSDDET